MQLSLRPSSKGTDLAAAAQGGGRKDPTLPAILEYQSPSTAIVTVAIPRHARIMSSLLCAMVLACLGVLSVVEVDRVVTVQGRVVSTAPTMVLQPLDNSIVRSIEVKPGDQVKAGQVLARLDPTFAAADLSTLATQVASLQAQTARMQAEIESRPFAYSGLDPNLMLQAAIFAQRQAEYNFRMEGYAQKINGLAATIARTKSDAEGFRNRLAYAVSLETVRRELERLNVGSKLNTLQSMDARVEMERNLESAEQQNQSAQRDLAAMVAERNAYSQNWFAEGSQKLSEALVKLSDARESLNKAQLHRQLVELRAERDGTVLSVAKVAVGSVVNAGQQIVSLVPSNTQLEIEVNIPASQDGYVHVGDPVTLKFDTFNYALYGMAFGTVRMISPDSFTTSDEQRNPTGALDPMAGPAGGAVWYRGRVAIDRIELHDIPPNFQLMPGMTVVSDIRIGKRTVMRYLLGRVVPLAQEGMREP